MLAAAAMALSSLSVVGNANRLRRHRPAHRDTEQGTYHFCSPHCAATFDTDPHSYTSALRQAATPRTG
jgi:hypothetical protein